MTLLTPPVKHQDHSLALHSKLKLLVSSIGTFFTPLPLAEAFKYQDARRHISSRRFVPPSFNDIRLILNTAQVMGLCLPSPTAINANAGPGLQLATFDGDVTLYDDGKCLEPSNPVIPRILELMRRDVRIGIVTAAGYTEAARYYERLHGLLEAIKASPILTSRQKENLIIMGGESNFLFQYDLTAEHLLTWVPRRQWILEEMKHWQEPLIQSLLDQAEEALKQCIANLALDAMVVRKERAVGFIPTKPGARFPRECLEETVLVVQKMIEMSPVGDAIPFCVFNGGNDVFVDIGDKSWGVLVCQKYFRERDAARTAAGGNPTGKSHVDGEVAEGTVECRIPPSKTMHVGDQFLSANGANDFRARKVGTTAWVASPEETVTLLDEVRDFMEMAERKRV
jgi:IMP and pyridine-specific 5'-nucleotidase